MNWGRPAINLRVTRNRAVGPGSSDSCRRVPWARVTHSRLAAAGVMHARVVIDGKQTPDDRIRGLFRWPPDLAPECGRSALVIGSRGVGKTTLFVR